MRKLQALVSYIFHLFNAFGFVLVAGTATAMTLSGCVTTPKPVVVTQNIVVAPADNLLVDCDVAAPPPKASYLATTATIPGINPNTSLQKDDAFYLVQYAKTIKALEERERQLTEHALKQFQNLDACNKRWQQLRAWKVNSEKQFNAPQKE
jgi:hypothetical protein